MNEIKTIGLDLAKNIFHVVCLDKHGKAIKMITTINIDGRTALCNRLRGLLAEYGLVLPQDVNTLRKRLPELLEDAENGLTPLFRELLAHELQALRDVDESVKYYDQLLAEQTRENEATQRLQTVPGYGPVVSSAFWVAMGDGQAYPRGRDVSASLGLVPRQHSSGGKNVLLGISKRGDRYLRSLWVHAARAVLRQAERKDDRLSQWAVKIKAERGFNKAAVALANKLARIGWAVLYNRSTYQTVEV